MLTIKQLQTFYWVARLGTLNKAADKLYITQSAATKRLQEVEAIAAAPLFEGEGKKALLTPKGKDLLAECEQLLDLLAELDKLKGSAQQPARTLHVGLTDLTVLTWLPTFLRRMKEVYPTITIQPEIDLSVLLQRKVVEGRLDFAILPDPPAAEGLARVPVGEAQFGWFAAPGAFSADTVYALRELGTQTVIEQSAHSIITTLCARLWEGAGLQPERIYGGNNVVALAGLISAGVGVSCLPVALFSKDVEAGKMQLVRTDPPAPSVVYFATFLKYPHSVLSYSVADIARACCDFSA